MPCAASGAVSLLDLAALLPQWVSTSEALQSWKVPDPEGVSLFRFYTSWSDVPPVLRPPNGPLRETMFPDVNLASELSKCVRLLPGTQESEALEGAAACGGCFMALFGKDSHRAANAADWSTTKPQGNFTRKPDLHEPSSGTEYHLFVLRWEPRGILFVNQLSP